MSTKWRSKTETKLEAIVAKIERIRERIAETDDPLARTVSDLCYDALDRLYEAISDIQIENVLDANADDDLSDVVNHVMREALELS